MTEAQERVLLATVAGLSQTIVRQVSAINEQAKAIEQLGAILGYEFSDGAWRNPLEEKAG